MLCNVMLHTKPSQLVVTVRWVRWLMASMTITQRFGCDKHDTLAERSKAVAQGAIP